MRALEKLACRNCNGEGYIDNRVVHEGDPAFDVCGSCMSTGSERYTVESMQKSELAQQNNDIIEMIKYAIDRGEYLHDQEGETTLAFHLVMGELDSILENHDPERLVQRAEEKYNI